MKLLRRQGIEFEFYNADIRNAHPNTALIEMVGKNDRKLSVQASSLGGGRIMVNKIDGIDVNFQRKNRHLSFTT